MKYNINFELSALCFLFILIIFFFVKRKHIQRRSRIYAVYLVFIFIDIGLNIVTSLLSTNPHIVPIELNYLLNTAFLFLQISIPSIFLTYITTLTNFFHKKVFYLFYIPYPNLMKIQTF